MKYLSLILILAILTVGIFGFMAMNDMNGGCVSSTTGVDCPTALLAMALHHVTAYQNFSEATVIISTLILLLTVAALFLGCIESFHTEYIESIPIRFRLKEVCNISTYRYSLARYLSLFEHSPSA